jgi:DNA-binding MarR family transcriptional regulator
MSVRVVDSVELANRLRPVLLMLIRNHPQLGVRELAAREGISAPSMTRYLDRLEKAGLVVRTRSPEDARRIRLALTPKGVRVLRSVRRRRTAWLAERLDGLDPAEQRAVADAVEPLARLLQEEER